MFKKRGIKNLQTPNQGNQTSSIIIKRQVHGIDLRKDVLEMEKNISQIPKREDQKFQKYQRRQQQDQTQQKQQQTFKTKKINKFTNHILNRVKQQKQKSIISQQVKSQPTFQLEQIINIKEEIIQQQIIQNNSELVQLGRYGLLDKSHFRENSIESHSQIRINNDEGKGHDQVIMDHYIKKKIQQMSKKGPSNTSKFVRPGSQVPIITQAKQDWQKVRQIQNQYLTHQQDQKLYSIKQVQKRLQKMSQQTIKKQNQYRTLYFKDLLQNENQRTQYATKKELKMMRQDKQRIQKELNSKYRQSGRRHYIQSVKNSISYV